MEIDKGTFFILVTTLAAGGAGGYVASQKRLLEPYIKGAQPPPPSPAPPVVDAGPLIAAPAPPPPTATAPACSDDDGAPGDCPAPGFPTFEGGCGAFARNRCGEFKQAMKPKVAEVAVACLNKLTPKERCDKIRVDLCGHLALENACPEPPPIVDPADAGLSTRKGPVATACESIIAACGPSPLAPSPIDCHKTLSGLTDKGRERMSECVKKHCFDKGLLGCEAAPAP